MLFMPAVLIYTLAKCPYCADAKRLLNSYGVDFDEIDVTSDEQMRAWLKMATGFKTLPQTFIDSRAIGGYQDLVELDNSGSLARMLHRQRIVPK